MSSKQSSAADEIRELIQRLNDAWVKGQPGQLASFFREDIVIGAERFKASGRDLFVFIRQNDRWQAVWRTMIIPQEEKVN